MERSVCVKWAALWLCVTLYIVYWQSVITLWNAGFLQSVCVCHQCENDTALPPCEAKSHCMRRQTMLKRLEHWALGGTGVAGRFNSSSGMDMDNYTMKYNKVCNWLDNQNAEAKIGAEISNNLPVKAKFKYATILLKVLSHHYNHLQNRARHQERLNSRVSQ